MKIAIKNVNLVTHGGIIVRDVFLEDGEGVEVMENPDREIDGTGKYLMPGAIDVHVHFREPGSSYKEDWEHASAAAAVGGVTTVLDMPNNNPATVTEKVLEEKRDLIKGRSYVNYGFNFGVAENFEELEVIEDVKAFKVYMGKSTGDMLVDGGDLKRVFEIAKKRGLPVIVHAEDEDRIEARTKEFAGQDEARTHALIRDNEAARLAVEAAIKLREEVGNRLHIAHMSTKEEVALVKKHKCPELTCEVAPHHLYFSIEDLVDSRLKMNPPLRSEEDVRVLWEAVRDGTVDCLATDHAPHTLDEKNQVHWDAPAGVPGVEFLLPLMLNEVNEKLLDFTDLVRLLYTGPINTFNICNTNGNYVLIDMNLEKTIDNGMVKSKCEWTPYEGYKLKGWPIMTIVNGEIVAEDGEITGGKVGKEL
jgi:dihydroorotase